MNAVLCWKEYRQQRGLWLAILALAMLLAVIIAETLGRGTGLEVFQDDQVRGILTWIGFSLMMAYGVACGAMLLAGEKEDATLVFLDTLPAARHAVWHSKVLAGILLTFSQGFLLAAVGVGLKFLRWDLALTVPILGADALIWGLVGGALCRNVLLAVLTGVALLMASWVVALLMSSALALLLTKLLLAGVAIVWSRRLFSEPDQARVRYAQNMGLEVPHNDRTPDSWTVMIWLIMRQGRWVWVGITVASVALGLAVNLAPLLLYPAGTLIIGLACGLAVFVPEQVGRQHSFLGAQRFPPGKIWAFKVGYWAVTALYLTGLLWAVAVYSLIIFDAQYDRYTASDGYWKDKWWGEMFVDGPLFIGLWVINGFCVGQLCGLWAKRPVIAVILAGILGTVLSAIWLPSVLIGGLELWQVFATPVILLISTRFFVWRWLTDRLYGWPSILGMAGLCLAAVLSLAAGLWYRVSEVPDAGDPPGLQEFIATIPSPDTNEAGRLLRRAGREMQTEPVFKEVPPAPAGGAPRGPAPPGAAVDQEPPAKRYKSYLEWLGDALYQGWPKNDADLARWLDRLCAGPWFKNVHQAARLPLGVVQDPRQLDLHSAAHDEFHLRELITVLDGRARQSIVREEPRQVLELLETLLGLSRQLRNHSTSQAMWLGKYSESAALTNLARWLETRPDAKYLKEALALLRQHESLRPDRRDTLLAEYVIDKNTFGSETEWSGTVHVAIRRHVAVRTVCRLAWLIPWERERQERVGRVIYGVWLRALERPYWERVALAGKQRLRTDGTAFDVLSAAAREVGLPPTQGPGADLSARHWGKLFLHSWLNFQHGLGQFIATIPPTASTQLRAEILVTALVLYEAEQDQLPDRLQELTPRYLPEMPLDPFTGRPFHYRISKGEKLEGSASFSVGGEDTVTLLPGQAVIWSDGIDSFRPGNWKHRYLFVVPQRRK